MPAHGFYHTIKTGTAFTKYNLPMFISGGSRSRLLADPGLQIRGGGGGVMVCLFVIFICLPTEHKGVHKNVSVHSRSNWNLKVWFKERGKLENPAKNLSEQGREPTTNSTHIWCRRQDSNPGHIGGRPMLSPLCHSCSPNPMVCYGIFWSGQ